MTHFNVSPSFFRFLGAAITLSTVPFPTPTPFFFSSSVPNSWDLFLSESSTKLQQKDIQNQTTEDKHT